MEVWYRRISLSATVPGRYRRSFRSSPPSFLDLELDLLRRFHGIVIFRGTLPTIIILGLVRVLTISFSFGFGVVVVRK